MQVSFGRETPALSASSALPHMVLRFHTITPASFVSFSICAHPLRRSDMHVACGDGAAILFATASGVISAYENKVPQKMKWLFSKFSPIETRICFPSLSCKPSLIKDGYKYQVPND